MIVPAFLPHIAVSVAPIVEEYTRIDMKVGSRNTSPCPIIMVLLHGIFIYTLGV